ncbi:hypothetical protein [Cohnella fermenti]|uniref:Uncharacterized protein n=1 Tax=Cohnella fermenti TaxID=2565925 RepID=A0A4S4BQE3_9BACL|nr:hypothetical protein [Cohnella fermenti]THF77142.1 hypothetical protein E6C55_17415 [Cohnella fermenti]
MSRTQHASEEDIRRMADAANRDAAFRERMLRDIRDIRDIRPIAEDGSDPEAPLDLMVYVVDGTSCQLSLAPPETNPSETIAQAERSFSRFIQRELINKTQLEVFSMSDNKQGQLSENELESVAGGGLLKSIGKAVKKTANDVADKAKSGANGAADAVTGTAEKAGDAIY